MDYENYRNVGLTKIIVIKTVNRNVGDLEKLGLILKNENINDQFSFIYIFDDKKAADMFNDNSEWTKEQQDFYDNHFIASFNKNINTGLNRFFIHLPENDGGELIINYN